jgi:hypothetical protein
MRTLALAAATAVIMSMQLAAVARADDTTVIRKDGADTSTTVVKKHDDINLFPVPHSEENKVIIHRDQGMDD